MAAQTTVFVSDDGVKDQLELSMLAYNTSEG